MQEPKGNLFVCLFVFRVAACKCATISFVPDQMLPRIMQQSFKRNRTGKKLRTCKFKSGCLDRILGPIDVRAPRHLHTYFSLLLGTLKNEEDSKTITSSETPIWMLCVRMRRRTWSVEHANETIPRSSSWITSSSIAIRARRSGPNIAL